MNVQQKKGVDAPAIKMNILKKTIVCIFHLEFGNL